MRNVRLADFGFDDAFAASDFDRVLDEFETFHKSDEDQSPAMSEDWQGLADDMMASEDWEWVDDMVTFNGSRHEVDDESLWDVDLVSLIPAHEVDDDY